MQTHVTSRLATLEHQFPTPSGSRISPQQQPLQRTQGEIEADVCEVVRRYSIEYMGRGPKDVRAYLLEDLLIVRMFGIFTVAEQHLAARASEKGTLLLKQVRGQLIEVARKELEAMNRVCTSVHVLSLHHDICTVTEEEILVFTLDASPSFRPIKRK